ncbi:hypothetical protein ACQ4M3_01330 [Leptolyngbya sp. AN03gr2]|uniref:hypothetical protein n=1 Tax=unclassified Leptolyngbya TaxID=2650499 RepID=UPI003D314622
MQRRLLLLALFSLPITMSIASKTSVQAQYVPKNPDEAAIVQLVRSRYPKATVTRLAIADHYGLYSWIDGETGGQTVVLKDLTANQWQFVRGTGGMLRAEDITGFGVPQPTALKLVDAIQQQIRSSSRTRE